MTASGVPRSVLANWRSRATCKMITTGQQKTRADLFCFVWADGRATKRQLDLLCIMWLLRITTQLLRGAFPVLR